jgi:hypothetical protein
MSGDDLRECVVGFEPRRGDGDLEHRNQVPQPPPEPKSILERLGW